MLRLRIYNHYTLEARLLWDSYCEVSLRMRKICFYFFFFLSNFGVKKTAIILSNDVKFYCACVKFVFIFSSFFSTSQLVKGLKSKNSRVRSKKNFLSEKNAIMLSNDVKIHCACAKFVFIFSCPLSLDWYKSMTIDIQDTQRAERCRSAPRPYVISTLSFSTIAKAMP